MRRQRLHLDEGQVVRECLLRLLGAEQRAAQTFKRLRAGGPHGQGLAVRFRRLAKLIVLQLRRTVPDRKPEARRLERRIDRRVLRTVLLGLGEEADRSAKVGLLHAHIAHACKGVRFLRVLRQDGAEALFSVGQTFRVQGAVRGSIGCGTRAIDGGCGTLLCRQRRRAASASPCRPGHRISMQRLVQLIVRVLGQIGADFSSGRRILRIPHQRLA